MRIIPNKKKNNNIIRYLNRFTAAIEDRPINHSDPKFKIHLLIQILKFKSNIEMQGVYCT